jgi:hypothetical protein
MDTSDKVSASIAVVALCASVAAIIVSVANQNSSNSTALRVEAQTLSEARTAAERTGQGTAAGLIANIHAEKTGLVRIWAEHKVLPSAVPLQEFQVGAEEFTNLLAATPPNVRLFPLSGLYGKLTVSYGILDHDLGLGHQLPSSGLGRDSYHHLLCGTMGYLTRVENPLKAVAGDLVASYPMDAALTDC